MASSSEKHIGHFLDPITEEVSEVREKKNQEIAIRSDKRPGDERLLGRPTWTRMSRVHLATEILDRYKIEYELDLANPDYVLIKRWVPEYEQDFLWAATRRLREDRDPVFTPDDAPHEPLDPDHPEIIKVVRTNRGSELSLEINHVPFEKWIKWRGGKKRGKNVLDVAMKTLDTDEQANHAGKTAIPVRLAINSNIVREELSRIAEVGVYDMRSVIIPPWKPLVEYYTSIQERLEKLKALKVERDAGKIEKKGANIKPEATTVEARQATSAQTEADLDHSVPSQDEDQKFEIVEKPGDFTQHSKTEEKGQASTDHKKKDTPELSRCEGCFVRYPPHDTPLECLDLRISHLQCLVEFMNEDLKDVFDLRRGLAEKTVREIAFDDLWHLFCPGDLIVTSEPRRAYRVFHTSAGRELLARPKTFEKRPVKSAFELDCFYVESDSKVFGPVHETLRISEYTGKHNITSLLAKVGRRESNKTVTIAPLKYLDNPETTLAHLIERGEKRRGLAPYSQGHYQGPATVVSSFDDGPRFGSPRLSMASIIETTDRIDSDIVIDLEEVFDFKITPAIGFFDWFEDDPRELAEGCEHWGILSNNEPLRGWRPECTCSDIVEDFLVDHTRAARYKEDLHLLAIRSIDEEMTKDHLMLLPPDIEAFVLQSRQVALLSVDLIQELDKEWNGKTEFKDLVLPEGREHLLKALVGTHPTTGNLTSNTKAGVRKGKALIILLHGPSGLGKTETARAIANYTQKPLFPLFLGDYTDRREMPTHIRRCSAWHCILFIDEAESSLPINREDSFGNYTFLLSNLDNFDGIVILTANDASAIDGNVVARVDVSLPYHRFTDKSSIKVWKIHLERMKKDENVKFDKEDVLEFAKEQYKKKTWHGKQIKNCLRMAVSLAEYEAGEGGEVVLKMSHLDIAEKVVGW